MRWTYPLSSVQVTASEKQEESDRQARIVQEQEQARRAETEQIQHARQAKELFEPLQQQKSKLDAEAAKLLLNQEALDEHQELKNSKTSSAQVNSEEKVATATEAHTMDATAAAAAETAAISVPSLDAAALLRERAEAAFAEQVRARV